jgi:site-specific DNA-methyltransferase (adenine-specific)
MLYLGDNLDIMPQLPRASIQLIYGDILFGTGRTFNDFTDLESSREAIDAFYRPRITEMYFLLKDTGSVILHMDNRIDHWIRLILEDIFGYDRFVNQIIWAYTQGGKSKTRFAKKHDILYWYSKTDKWKFYGDRVKVPYEVTSPNAKSAFTKVDSDGRLYKESYGSGSKKKYKYYADEGKIPNDWWSDIYNFSGRKTTTSSEYTGYSTQKPESLLNRIILATTDEGDKVLDPFLGSGTTAVVAHKLNREYIGIDINPRAIQITEERLCQLKH